MQVDQTEAYIEAFTSKNTDLLSGMLVDDFVLEDPVIKRVEGKEASLKYMQELFNSCSKLEFSAKNIFSTNSGETIIEFTLELDDVKLEGVDIIVWEGNKLKELRAYLDVPK